MNILRRELRSGLRSLLIWVAILGTISLMMAYIFPTFAADAERLDELMSLFPPEIIRAFGIDRLSMGDPIGFYATEMYVMIILGGSIFAALLGSGLLAKEEDEKTIEFLLAKPVCRGSILLQKALTFAIMLVAFNLGVALLTFASFAIFIDQPYSVADLARLSAAPFFAHFAFGSLGFLSALFWTRRRAVYSVSIGVAVGTYFLGMVSLIAERFAWLRWLSPYRYVEAADIVVDGRLEPLNVLILLLVSAVALATTYHRYRRRDITI